MAHAKIKSGGPNRGKLLVKKMGMGSGKARTKASGAKAKGKRG